jgi:hypothetical protein
MRKGPIIVLLSAAAIAAFTLTNQRETRPTTKPASVKPLTEADQQAEALRLWAQDLAKRLKRPETQAAEATNPTQSTNN